MLEVKVYSLALDSFSKAPIVLLTDKAEENCLPIWIGVFEANSIMIAINNIKLPRPLTHDLIISMLTDLKAKIKQINITGLKEGVYFAEVILKKGKKELKIDSRPSDSIAIAIRAEAPIYIDPGLESSMIKLEEFRSRIIDEHLKTILDNLKEDDFGKYKM